MKTFNILSVVCLLILGSSWAAAQTNRGNPRDGQAIYDKQCLRCQRLQAGERGLILPHISNQHAQGGATLLKIAKK